MSVGEWRIGQSLVQQSSTLNFITDWSLLHAMNAYLHYRLADQLICEWIVEEIELDQETLPDNASDASAFFTAATQLSELEDVSIEESDSPVYDPKFITKTTLHRLYRELTQLEENYSSTTEQMNPDSLMENLSVPEEAEGYEIDEDRFREAVAAKIDSNAPGEFAESLFAIHAANRLLPFLTIGQAVIDESSIQLLNKELISNFYRDTNNTIEFLENDLSQPNREQLLQRSGVLDGGVIGQMADVRQTRNNLVHDLRSQEYFEEIVDSVDIVDSMIDVLNEFEQRLNEREIDWRR